MPARIGNNYFAITARGPEHGIQILAASVRANRLEDYVTRHFATRLVLRMEHEEQSVILLGDYAAADLGGGGQMLVRIAGCSPIEARGFRISPEHLDQLVGLMREVFQSSLRRSPPARKIQGTTPPQYARGVVMPHTSGWPSPSVSCVTLRAMVRKSSMDQSSLGRAMPACANNCVL